MTIEDVNNTLGYPGTTGYLGSYYFSNHDNINEYRKVLITVAEYDEFDEINGTNKFPGVSAIPAESRNVPEGSTKEFSEYLSDYYFYTGSDYKNNSTKEYKVIFMNKEETAHLPIYWLSSQTQFIHGGPMELFYEIRAISSGIVSLSWTTTGLPAPITGMYGSSGSPGNNSQNRTCALRPVVVLNTNIQFGEKNADGEWTLVQM